MAKESNGYERCKELIDDTYKKYNRLDILVNNEGMAKAASMEEPDPNIKILPVNGSIFIGFMKRHVSLA